ncbi:Protein Asterix [Folsomia candida]|uniref:Protein Asterix n=1 Tax=Folsomia candida TaxID=158441 RepID=A0A226EKI0_FOLCA|nr:Protein Asterix [Folsomia candida]
MDSKPSGKKKFDPRCKNREVSFSNVRKINMDEDPNIFEINVLVTMIVSIVAWKYAGWFALSVSIVNISYFRAGNDLKQIFSSIFISFAALYMMYLKNPDPIGDSIFSVN